ncbi:MAG: hypothetical protein EBT13_08180 [Rhodobacteraceae bacterium]|nr:hypothetical protein [Paracoccaceae bacterium]
MRQSRFSVRSAAVMAFLFVPAFASAQSEAAYDLFIATGQPEIIQIMREEGLDYGEMINSDLLGDTGGAKWRALVSDIYDAELMTSAVQAAFVRSISEEDAAAALSFFSSDAGKTIIVSARRAMLDDAAEAAANDAAAIAAADQTDRQKAIETFVVANDLIETNVVGAMNSNYAFYLGMMDGGALQGELTEDQILSDVWSQEADIRQTTGEWVYSFLTLAYQPLSDADMAAYIAFSETPAGRALNNAYFAAYDDLFNNISRALGYGAAQAMTGSDL